MLIFSSDPQINAAANQQLEYFVNRYKQNHNENVLRAKAEIIIKKALKNWQPSKGNIKTYLSSQLQQLSRELYKNQVVYIPENQQLLMYKAQQIINTYNDTYGGMPDAKYLAKQLNVTEKKAKNLLNIYGGIVSHQYDTEIKSKSITSYSPKEIISTIPDPLHKEIADDLYLKNKSKDYIYKKYGIKQTKFYEIKKGIDSHINRYAEAMNTENDKGLF